MCTTYEVAYSAKIITVKKSPWCNNVQKFSCWFETSSDKLQNVNQSVSV